MPTDKLQADDSIDSLRRRASPLEMSPESFRDAGHRLVDRIAELLSTMDQRPVTPHETPAVVREILGSEAGLPDSGRDAGPLLQETAEKLTTHSLFNGHPRFWGYITSSAAPIGVLGDFLAAAVNPNVGAWKLAPLATEIEAQTVRWIAELIGYPTDCGGLLVSGGNMANFVCFVAARTAKAKWDVRKQGLGGVDARRLRIYASKETHTWLEKGADVFGLGTDSIRWIGADKRQRLDMHALRQAVDSDLARGDAPFLVVGTAGSVSTGAVDPLPEISAFCREKDLWFHVDGAYGAMAARVAGAPDDLASLSLADSVAVDPHKWLYAPLEAGCTLVRRPQDLTNAYSYHPPYYHFEQQGTNYFDIGLQNSRGFRALKVWLALSQVGWSGYERMISDDMRLSRRLHELVGEHPQLEALTQGLSIATFRYVPTDLGGRRDAAPVGDYLNELNRDILDRVERTGEAFLSNAEIGGWFALRACIVNFRTALEDIEALPDLVARLGREADAAMRPKLKAKI